MSNPKFDPNEATFEDGVKRVKEALAKTNFKMEHNIVTSRDKGMAEVLQILEVDNIPHGFKKWQLPIILERSQLYISVGNPDTKVPEHSHDEGDGIRFIISGSIQYAGKELTAGDWMFIPKGAKYQFTVGATGCMMCYCYCCCCARPATNS